jgi:hypothetical protein
MSPHLWKGLDMKRQIALGLALAMVAASTSVEAQLGGFLKKKAREAIEGKEAEAPPTPAPTPAPTPGTKTPDTPPSAPARSDDRAAAAPAKVAVSPLEASELPVRESANEVLRGRGNLRDNGDWDQLPRIPAAAVAAAYALGDAAQVALVETVGTALKAMVMSAAFLAEHDKYVKAEHHGADHGLKGIVGIEAALKKNDLKTLEAIQARETVAMGVDRIRMAPEFAKTEFTEELAKWKVEAAKPRRDRAKFQKLVAMAQPLEGLAANDEKFLRGYAVLLSVDNDGPATEEAVFAMHQRVTQEKEQLAYDEHNLKGQLKQQLTTFVAIASKVNFDAKTVEKDDSTLFVNPADEQQGALWKACFRAGEAPTAAALKLARAWLAEL